jgi:glycosyltransferase involved in cell wall biosynthesis
MMEAKTPLDAGPAARTAPKNRKLAVGFPFDADCFGGSTVCSLILAQSLAESGHRVCIVVHGLGRVIDEAREKGLKVVLLPPLYALSDSTRKDRFRVQNLLALSTCRRLIQDWSLDIIHTNDLEMLRTWALPTRVAGARFFAHWRGNYRKSLSVTASLGLAHVVVAVSEYSKSRLPIWIQAKTLVEYDPFGLFFEESQRATARSQIRARVGLPMEAAVVGVFGNHTVRKRTHVLADVLHAVPLTADGKPVYGLACGGRIEPYDTQLGEKIAAFRLENRLLRPGFVRPVEEWMAACDVILAPAEREPLAHNVLEAQGVGVPVIVSCDGGLREIVTDGETGILLDPFKTDDWIASTRTILNDRTLSAKITAQARRQLENLSPDRHAFRVSAIYRRLTQH